MEYPTIIALENAKKRFGARVKALRESRGYTRDVIAKKLGITVTTLYRIETGKQAASWEVIQGIMTTFGGPPAYYFNMKSRPLLPAPPPKEKDILQAAEEAIRLAARLGPDLIGILSAMNQAQLEDLAKALASRLDPKKVAAGLNRKDDDAKKDDGQGSG